MTSLLACSGLGRTSQRTQQDLTCSCLSIPFYNCIGCSKHTLFFYDTYLPPFPCYTHHPVMQHGGGGSGGSGSGGIMTCIIVVVVLVAWVVPLCHHHCHGGTVVVAVVTQHQHVLLDV